MNKCNLKITDVVLQHNLNGAIKSVYCQWCSEALDIIESRIFKSPVSKAKRKVPTNICKISFLNKCL